MGNKVGRPGGVRRPSLSHPAAHSAPSTGSGSAGWYGSALTENEPNPWNQTLMPSPHTYPPGTKLPPDFHQNQQKQKPFHKWERDMLKTTFADLASRSASGKTIDKETFLKFFSNVPGMLGERLFYVFNRSGSGALDFDEFIGGLAQYSRGSMEQKVQFLFRMCNLSNNGRISRSEMMTMVNSFLVAAESVVNQMRHVAITQHQHAMRANGAGVGGGGSTPPPEKLRDHLQQMKSRAHSPSFQYSPPSDGGDLLARIARADTAVDGDARWANPIDDYDDAPDDGRPAVSRPGSITLTVGGSAAHTAASTAASTAGIAAYQSALPAPSYSYSSASPFVAPGLTVSSPTLDDDDMLSPSQDHDPNQDQLHSTRVKDMVDDAFRWSGGGGNGPITPPTNDSATAAAANSPAVSSNKPDDATPSAAATNPTIAPAATPGLSMYQFGKWLQNHPEILDVLDSALTGKEAFGYIEDQQQQQQSNASISLSSGPQVGPHIGLIPSSHRSSFTLGKPPLVHRASLNGGNSDGMPMPMPTIDPREVPNPMNGTNASGVGSRISVPGILTPQPPAAPAAANQSSNTMNSDNSTPMLGPTVPVIVDGAVSSSLSSSAKSDSDKATWKNGPRLSISGGSSMNLVGVSGVVAPTSSRHATTSLVGVRYSPHTHAHTAPGALARDMMDGTSSNMLGSAGSHSFHHHQQHRSSFQSMVSGSSSSQSYPTSPIPPVNPFYWQCESCGHTLSWKCCIGCGATLTCINANAANTPPTNAFNQTTLATMQANTIAAGGATTTTTQTNQLTTASQSPPNHTTAGVSAPTEYLCLHCPTQPFGIGQVSPRFCPACACANSAGHSCTGHSLMTRPAYDHSKSLLASSSRSNGVGSVASSNGLALSSVPPHPHPHHLTSRTSVGCGGQISIEGFLKKVGARFKNIMSRWYVIRDNFMYTYNRPGDFKPAHVLFLEGCFVEAVNHEERSSKLKYGIEIILSEEPQRKSRLVYASSHESRQQWLESIRVHANVHDIDDYYTLGKELGVGRFSSVREGISKVSGKRYAVKIIDKSEVNEKEREALRTEVAVLKLVHHPSIIRLKNVFETRKQIFIVMSFVRGGDLFDRLVKRKRFSEATTQQLMLQLIQVVQYLHVRGIVHRDLKPENILIKGNSDDDIQIMLADFGLGAFALPDQSMKLACLTSDHSVLVRGVGWVPLTRVEKGEQVWGLTQIGSNHADWTTVMGRVTRKLEPDETLIQIENEDGVQLMVTEDHDMWTRHGQTHEWTSSQAATLGPDQHIPTAAAIPADAEEYRWELPFLPRDLHADPAMHGAWCQFIGLFLSVGSLSVSDDGHRIVLLDSDVPLVGVTLRTLGWLLPNACEPHTATASVCFQPTPTGFSARHTLLYDFLTPMITPPTIKRRHMMISIIDNCRSSAHEYDAEPLKDTSILHVRHLHYAWRFQLASHQARSILKGWMSSAGESTSFKCASRTLVDDLAILSTRAGWSSIVSTVDGTEGPHWLIEFRQPDLHPSASLVTSALGSGGLRRVRGHGETHVHCLTTDAGNFLVRRDFQTRSAAAFVGNCGTLTFTAPEVLTGKGYGMEVDLWSIGVICYMLLRGTLPFDGRNADEIRDKTIAGRWGFDSHACWNEVSPECKDFIKGLLTVDPAQRLTCQQALEHPFLKLKLNSPVASTANSGPAAASLLASGCDSSVPASAEPSPVNGSMQSRIPASIVLDHRRDSEPRHFASHTMTLLDKTSPSSSPTPSIDAPSPIINADENSLSSSVPTSRDGSLASSLTLPPAPLQANINQTPIDAMIIPPELNDSTVHGNSLPITLNPVYVVDSRMLSDATAASSVVSSHFHPPIPIDSDASHHDIHDSPDSHLSPVASLLQRHFPSSVHSPVSPPAPHDGATSYVSPQPLLPNSPLSTPSQLVLNARDSDDEEEGGTRRAMFARMRSPASSALSGSH